MSVKKAVLEDLKERTQQLGSIFTLDRGSVRAARAILDMSDGGLITGSDALELLAEFLPVWRSCREAFQSGDRSECLNYGMKRR